MRIRSKLILSNIIVVAFSVLVVSLPVLFLQTRELKSNIEQSAIQNMAIASSDISAFLKKSKVIINDMASYLQANAVAEIAENINSLENMISRQSEGVSQASAAVEEMVGNMGNISAVNHNVEIMTESFEKLETNARIGIEKQKSVAQQVNEVAEQSKTLQEANKAIASVASQTNLLAMNAAMKEQQEGSKQIVESLKIMNDNTTEVRTASHEMAEGNRLILDEVHNLQDTTLVIKQSMKEMSIGAREMNGTSSALSEISSKVRDSIKIIGSEIDQFKV